ncbi:MAG: hypothetical protein Q4B01_04880 [Eubacteriales bacterium]|nr:hypothetical protein [Eubacteriales bacterium]
MANLIKYEIIKQKTSKMILGAFLLAAELLFLVGIATKRDSILSLSIIALTLTAIAGFVLVAVEAIFTYYEDMKKKQGYMLFMTPYSEYTILGSKLLASMITIVVWTIFIGALTFIDLTMMAAAFNELDTFFSMVNQMVHLFFGIDISWGNALLVLLQMVFSWAAMVTSGFLAITLATTLFVRLKFNALISFVIYVVLNIIPMKAANLLMKLPKGSVLKETEVEITESMSGTLQYYTTSTEYTLIAFAVSAVFGIVCFLIAGRILNKKLSL